MFIICLIIIILLLSSRRRRLLSQAFFSWYFSWANADPHRSGFKFQTAVLSVITGPSGRAV